MLKHHFIIFSMLAAMCFPFTASAAESKTAAQDSINTQLQLSEKLETPTSGTEPAVSPSAAMKPDVPPPTVERKSIAGDEYLIKTYRTDENFDPTLLVEDNCERDGYIFSYKATEKKENKTEKTKDISEPVQVETQTNTVEDVLKQLPPTKAYDADGYTGTLTLDTASIRTDVAGYTTKTTTISTVQEYPGLMCKDPANLPQTAAKDGYTLSLADVTWTVMGTSLGNGNVLVPTEYKATATYSKKLSSQVPSGYITSAVYSGKLCKVSVDSVDYTVTYIGTKIFEPTPTSTPASTPSPSIAPTAPQKQPGLFNSIPWAAFLTVLIILLGAGVLAAGSLFLFRYIRSLRGIQVYNLIDREYVCVGRQTVDYKKPVLDLNYFKDVIQSNSFTFVMNKSDCKRLYGRNIAVTLDDVTVMHLVKGYNEEYRFNLELGGILDAQ